MIDDTKNNVQSAIEAGMVMAKPAVIEGEGYERIIMGVVPPGATLKLESVEKFMDRPQRKRGTFTFSDAKSFIAFVNREKTPETYILASRENPGFTAVFNGNEPQSGEVIAGAAKPGWGDYKAVYACPYSPEWQVWSAANKKPKSQAEFAQFIEDNFVDIVVPSPGFDPFYTNWPDGQTMIQVSRGLEAHTSATFASAVRLDNGQTRFRYEETVSGNVQEGQLDVPQKFAVGIPVFAGTDPWQIIAKLRYRISREGLAMWFEFERLFKITERAFDEARNEIATGTGVPIFLGSRSGN